MKRTLFASGSLLAALLGAAVPAMAQEGKQGAVVARDPQTGELRPPTAAERKALREQFPLAPAARPRAEVRIDGSRKVRLDERHQVYSTVARGADGQPVPHCVHGETPAAHATHDRAREQRDDTQ